MAECMTKGAKDLLVDAITQDAKKEWLLGLMNYIPVCSEAGVVGLAASAGMLEVHKPMRKAPELWNIKVDYTNEKGVTAPFDSPDEAGKIVLTMECEKGPPAGHGVAMHVIHPYAFEPLKK